MVEGRRGLGRGLSALLGEAETATAAAPGAPGGPNEVSIELIRRNADQPRRVFSEELLEELSASIKEKGVLQPILVRPAPGAEGEYQIVAGERRWRAAQRAGLRSMPVLVRDLDDLQVLEIGIVENVQRADLNAVEEAQSYRALMEKFGRTQEDVAHVVGKSRSHVANILRLLTLPEEVQNLLSEGLITAGHAKAIASAEDPAALARLVIEKGLSVRETEALAKRGGDMGAENKAPSPAMPRAPRVKDADTQALEADLSDVLGLDVVIDDRGGVGELRVRYATLEQLDDLCRRLTQTSPVEA
ncbi:ParB/RepB/Spo0J family partition protein [Caulobacter segnis]|uniref:ParB/RepB/Spo0J family partition protein n=1 Tax=Caulobacter segnis TaxID=88688 RepID=UPI00241011D9|nr:ParB/RepB/Spo0J family partition protein [Caulobacter segnis]MDG2521540.1 ParB/RepB/Spo0J family partition protein [Caulobacter segnis]